MKLHKNLPIFKCFLKTLQIDTNEVDVYNILNKCMSLAESSVDAAPSAMSAIRNLFRSFSLSKRSARYF